MLGMMSFKRLEVDEEGGADEGVGMCCSLLIRFVSILSSDTELVIGQQSH